jgi:hypothetical protein
MQVHCTTRTGSPNPVRPSSDKRTRANQKGNSGQQGGSRKQGRETSRQPRGKRAIQQTSPRVGQAHSGGGSSGSPAARLRSAEALLRGLRRYLPKAQWQNLLLVLAVQLARTLVVRKLSLMVLLGISSESCYRRLERVLSWVAPAPASLPQGGQGQGQGQAMQGARTQGRWAKSWKQMQRLWVQSVLRCFAPGRAYLVLIIDWTLRLDTAEEPLQLSVGHAGLSGTGDPTGLLAATDGDGRQREPTSC